MKQLKALLLILLALQLAGGLAQENLQFKKLTTLDGLSSNGVYGVRQDKHGFLWVIAGDALNRYDGKSFEVYKHDPDDSTSLGNQQIWELFLDKEENLWANGPSNISMFNYDDNSFINYPLENVFQIIPDSHGKFWLTTLEGTFEFDPATGTAKPIELLLDSARVKSTKLGAIHETKDGRLYVHQSRLGLFEYNRGLDVFKPVNWENGNLLNQEEFIYYIMDDTAGNIWLNGFNLYKYDRALNKVSKYDYGAPDRTWITGFSPDEEGKLWVSEEQNKRRVFYRLNPYDDTYEIIGEKNGLDDFAYSDFYMDKSGLYWIGGYSKGLYMADPSTEPIESLQANITPGYGIENDSITSIYASPFDPDVLWIGTRGYRLYRFHESTRSAEQIPLTFDIPQQENRWTSLTGLYEDKDHLWFGLYGVGLYRWDKKTGASEVFYLDINDANAVLSHSINKIVEGGDGNLWLGGNGGLSYFNVKDGSAKNYYSYQSKAYSNDIMDLFRDYRNGTPYSFGFTAVGDSAALSREFTIEKTQRFLVQSTGESWLWGRDQFNDYGWIENSRGDTLWRLNHFKSTMKSANAFRMKLDVLVLDPGKYTIHFISDSKNSADAFAKESSKSKDLYGIQLFELTYDKYDDFKEKITKENNQQLLSDFLVYDLKLHNDVLWITTGNGINRLQLETGEITYFEDNPSMGYNRIGFQDILAASDSVYWITSWSKGLLKFNPMDGSCTYFDMKDGLPSNAINSMVEDDLGNLWLGTDNGISKFINKANPSPPRFINYDTQDGLNSSNFRLGCAARSGSGKLYFGSNSGINSFFPTNVNSTPPIVGITRFYLRNREVKPNSPDSPLSRSILDTREIILTYEQNSFGFDFAAFHFSRPKKNKLAHMLEGFDQDWIYDNKSGVSYTNMDPGTYTFRVKGSNGDGFWNEEGASIKITILKPWWSTYWAYAGYVLAFALLVFVVDRVQRRRIFRKTRERMRLQQAEHRAETAELQAKAAEANTRLIQVENERKTKELLQAKEIEKAYTELKATQAQLIQSEKMASLGELTAGIAHEIQNPLNFVNNFSEVSVDMLEELTEELKAGNREEIDTIVNDLKQNLEKIHHHGKRASGIVKGMLEHSRAGNGLKEPTDINTLADEYLRLAYHGLRAKDKAFQAGYETALDASLPKVSAVPQDIGRVLLNIINNAFHAVSQKAKTEGEDYKPMVHVSTKNRNDCVEIRIRDNGTGIPQQLLDKIFQPFFTTKPTGQGTGLGLSLSYDIITKGHDGKLEVQTKEGEGTEFLILLNKSATHD